MALETQTLPGAIHQGKGGSQLASGWCLIVYEMAGLGQDLPSWRGEMICTVAEERGAVTGGSDSLYLHLRPYGGVHEAWHGPVTVEVVDPVADPYERRLKLRSAGPLIRSGAP